MAKTASCDGKGEPGSLVLSFFHTSSSLPCAGTSLLEQLSTTETSRETLSPSLGKDSPGFLEVSPPTSGNRSWGYLQYEWVVMQWGRNSPSSQGLCSPGQQGAATSPRARQALSEFLSSVLLWVPVFHYLVSGSKMCLNPGLLYILQP